MSVESKTQSALVDVDQLTPEVIQALKEKYPHNTLCRVDHGGRTFVARGSSYTEWDRIQKSHENNQSRLPMTILQKFIVWPKLDATDMEYNNSGEWEPGFVLSLSEEIQQQVLGYAKGATVKKL